MLPVDQLSAGDINRKWHCTSHHSCSQWGGLVETAGINMATLCHGFISLLILCTTVAEKETKSCTTDELLTKCVNGDGDQKVLVIDNLFTVEVTKAFASLVSFGSITGSMSSWEFNCEDYYQQIATPNASNNIAWVAPINQRFFMDSVIWQHINGVLQECSGGAAFFPYEVSASMIRRLDFTTVHNGAVSIT